MKSSEPLLSASTQQQQLNNGVLLSKLIEIIRIAIQIEAQNSQIFGDRSKILALNVTSSSSTL